MDGKNGDDDENDEDVDRLHLVESGIKKFNDQEII